MKHLVLGSAGQIGEALCRFLSSQDEEVITFDIVDSSHEDLRIHDNALLDERVKSADFVYFLAYDVGGARYLEKNQSKAWFMKNNMQLMCNTFSALERHSKPFLFASSQMADMKHSSYGNLKYIGEQMTLDLGGTITRFWNVYGPERDLEKAHVITDFVLKALTEKKIEMMTTGEETRQFLHATDCCRCLYMVSQAPQEFSSRFLDITSFEWTKIIDIAHLISSLAGNVPVIPGKKLDEVQKDMSIPPSKEILKYWEPEISLSDGIEDIKNLVEEIHGKVL
jgi:nucleoside-diphosphate-sugar epimerase